LNKKWHLCDIIYDTSQLKDRQRRTVVGLLKIRKWYAKIQKNIENTLQKFMVLDLLGWNVATEINRLI
jgi:G:T-mismatch repair DNA endonuclease (very short patch repair protein)